HVGGGDTTGRHEDDAKGQAPAGIGHEADAGGAGDVGDLVRVGDDSGHAARHDRGGELRRQTKAALDVDVRVDQSGGDVRAGEVDFLFPAIVAADAGDALAVDGDVGRVFDLAGEDVDDAGVLEKKVGGSVAAGNCEEVLSTHSNE